MSNGKNTQPPRQRERLEDDKDKGIAAQTGDPNAKTLPGGKDPRDPQYPGPMSTSENVTTDEQEAAQRARKEGDITDKDVGYGATASRAEQIESQTAAAENPLSPQSTSFNEPHAGAGAGLVAPPRPKGQKPIVPSGRPASWKFDPETGERLQAQRVRLEDDEDEDEDEVEVEVAHPVNLTLDGGEQAQYQPGKQKMPRSHAEHWYMKQHLVKKSPDEDKSMARKSAEAGDREERKASTKK